MRKERGRDLMAPVTPVTVNVRRNSKSWETKLNMWEYGGLESSNIIRLTTCAALRHGRQTSVKTEEEEILFGWISTSVCVCVWQQIKSHTHTHTHIQPEGVWASGRLLCSDFSRNPQRHTHTHTHTHSADAAVSLSCFHVLLLLLLLLLLVAPH